MHGRGDRRGAPRPGAGAPEARHGGEARKLTKGLGRFSQPPRQLRESQLEFGRIHFSRARGANFPLVPGGCGQTLRAVVRLDAGGLFPGVSRCFLGSFLSHSVSLHHSRRRSVDSHARTRTSRDRPGRAPGCLEYEDHHVATADLLSPPRRWVPSVQRQSSGVHLGVHNARKPRSLPVLLGK